MVTEFQQLQTEMERIADNTQYNGQNILITIFHSKQYYLVR